MNAKIKKDFVPFNVIACLYKPFSRSFSFYYRIWKNFESEKWWWQKQRWRRKKKFWHDNCTEWMMNDNNNDFQWKKMQTIFFVNLNSRLRMKKNSFKGLYFENDKKNENHEIFFLLQNSKMQISNSNFFFFLQTKPKKKNVLNKHHGKYRKTFDNHKRALFFNKKKD